MLVSCDADLIIVGGGCAGLSLARHLASCQNGNRVLVLESRGAYQNDRTWCFWGGPHHSNTHLVRHRWDAWEFSTAEQRAIQRSQHGIKYQCIPADVFYNDAIRQIQENDRVSLALNTQVERVSPRAGHVVVETCGGKLHAKWVIDTRPPSLSEHGRVILRQVFVGAEVRTAQDVFDPSVVGLMRDMGVDELGFRFTYVLPFSPRHALVEETRFSTQAVSRDRLLARLDATLSELAPAHEVETIRTESGCIPMSAETVQQSDGDRVVYAGTKGGAVRASSGYAFLRIQKWAAACAAKVSIGEGPLAHPVEPNWRSFIDRLFLRVVCVNPNLTPHLFMSMGQHLSAKTMVRFLSDDCRLSDFVRVAGVLPKQPFLRELVPSVRKGACL